MHTSIAASDTKRRRAMEEIGPSQARDVAR
jgi:hypothetical protein